MSDAGRRTKSLVFAALFLFSTCLTTSALAQDVDVAAVETAGAERNIVGLGVGFAPDYEGSEDYDGVPLLQARINFADGMYLAFLGNTLRVNLLSDPNLNVGPLLRYRPERDDVDNDRVDRMKDVDAAVEIGAFVRYILDNWIFQVSVAQDVADGHDGHVIDFGVGYRHILHQKALLTVFAKGSYASEDYMETYFDVDAADSARSGLPVYDADAEFKDIGLGALLQYDFTDRWGVLGLVQYTKLLGDAEDSPLVDDVGDEDQLVGGLIANYRF